MIMGWEVEEEEEEETTEEGGGGGAQSALLCCVKNFSTRLSTANRSAGLFGGTEISHTRGSPG